MTPPDAPYYPPRAGKVWVGRRARVAVRAERTALAALAGLRGLLVVLVPGLPFWVRGQRLPGLACLAIWMLALHRFLILRDQGGGEATVLRIRIPFSGFDAVQFDSSYLWFGLAAGLHILSASEFLRPVAQRKLRDAQPRTRLIATAGVGLGVGLVLYLVLYAPWIL
ncbi:MAG: hypothetical protein KF833_05240 [Verrucomicrobiae bacterium]|nr:hypothetical protein [Verrucomicrobiae bacterium]